MTQIEKLVYKKLYFAFGSRVGVAAIMGNIMAESSFNPKCANTPKRNATTDDKYTYSADHDEIDFINDKVAYGLVQWRYPTRKQGLLLMAKATNTSVGDLSLQVDYIIQELQTYKTVYQAVLTGIDLKEVTKLVLTRYEKPADQSENALNRRLEYARKYLSDAVTSGDVVDIELERRLAKTMLNWLDYAREHGEFHTVKIQPY